MRHTLFPCRPWARPASVLLGWRSGNPRIEATAIRTKAVPRTVRNMILAPGAVRAMHHSAFHRVFAAARWSANELAPAIFDLIEPRLGDRPVMLVIDDALVRKRWLTVSSVCFCERAS